MSTTQSYCQHNYKSMMWSFLSPMHCSFFWQDIAVGLAYITACECGRPGVLIPQPTRLPHCIVNGATLDPSDRQDMTHSPAGDVTVRNMSVVGQKIRRLALNQKALYRHPLYIRICGSLRSFFHIHGPREGRSVLSCEFWRHLHLSEYASHITI